MNNHNFKIPVLKKMPRCNSQLSSILQHRENTFEKSRPLKSKKFNPNSRKTDQPFSRPMSDKRQSSIYSGCRQPMKNTNINLPVVGNADLQRLPDLKSNTEMVGTATIDVILNESSKENEEIVIKNELPDDFESNDARSQNQVYSTIRRKMHQYRFNQENAKIKLNINIGEKSGKRFDLFSIKGLPRDLNQTSSVSDNKKVIEAGRKINNTPSMNTDNDFVNGENKKKIYDVNSYSTPTASYFPSNQQRHISLSNEYIDDDDVQFLEEVILTPTHVLVDIEERHPPVNGVCLVTITQKQIPITAVSFEDPCSKVNCDLTESSLKQPSEVIGEMDDTMDYQSIQYTIDKIPTTYSPPGKNGEKCNDNSVKIIAHSTSCCNDTHSNTYNEDINPSCGKKETNSTFSDLRTIGARPCPCVPCSTCPDDSMDVSESSATSESQITEQPIGERIPQTGDINEDTSQDNCQPDHDLTCPECSIESKTPYDKKVHLVVHLICFYCHKKFHTRERFNCHMLDVHGLNLNYCEHCNVTFINWATLIRHLRRNHLNIRRIRYLRDGVMTRHMQEHLQVMEHIQNVQYYQDLEQQDRLFQEKFKFACTACGKMYQTHGRFLLHLRTHSFLKNVCAKCQHVFIEKLPYHKGRFGVRIFCEICRERQLTERQIKDSELTFVTKNMKYTCEICKAIFNTLPKLERHLILHLQEARIRRQL